ncbi:MAG: TetR/AcrR family transcriptional regulator [Clostridiales bacterium]|nr:TetR/AcrR family transcriptional regulator [Clostridiales bacterium]
MASKLFKNLNNEKREKIFQTALHEFAQYGYNESSTNRIVKNAEISKGSLYKYFTSKEELYFDILDTVIDKYILSAQESIADLPEDLFERVISRAEMEFAWYLKYPDYYKLFKTAFLGDSNMYEKCINKYGNKASAIFSKLTDSVDIEKEIKIQKLSIIKWFMEGFNQSFIKENNIDSDIKTLKKKYIGKLREYLMILKSGI